MTETSALEISESGTHLCRTLIGDYIEPFPTCDSHNLVSGSQPRDRTAPVSFTGGTIHKKKIPTPRKIRGPEYTGLMSKYSGPRS